jgi:purine-binding chemotaxis protein CheW
VFDTDIEGARDSNVRTSIEEEIVEIQQDTNGSENSSGQRDLIAFRLGDQTYALPIEPIVRIIEMVTITPIPQLSKTVEGVINVQGKAVPVINLRRQFGLPQVPFGLRTPIIVVQVDEHKFGLVVDEVIDVLSLAAEQVVRVVDIMPDGVDSASILEGLVHIQNDTVLVLDVEHLLAPGQAQALMEVAASLPEVTIEEEAAEQVLEDAMNEVGQAAPPVDEAE